MSGGPDPARLVVIGGPLSGEIIHLSRSETTIGRDIANTICLPDAGVSRHHCALAPADAGWELRDLGSANGTFVNSVPVRVHQLAPADRIVVGESTLLFVPGAGADAAAAEFVESAPFTPTARLRVDETVYARPAIADTSARLVHGFKALLALTAAIGAVRTEDELHGELLSLIGDLAPATESALVLIGEGGTMSVPVSTGGAPGHPVRVSRSVVRRVVDEREGVLTKDAAATTFRTESLSLTGVRSLLCAPMLSTTSVLGAIYLARSDRAGAFDPDDLQLVTALGKLAGLAIENVRRIADLEQETERLRAGVALDHNLVGDSGPMRVVYDRISRVARADTTALIVGETGTGKELAARAIHANSARARRPFVAVNCAALAEALLESELFGHERGAFTGAVTQKKGKVELAEGGTLFLDEIAELPLLLQSKLLRVLQEREFERVGGTRPIKADIRVISATNRDLADEVAQKRFRQDLYFRLNVVAIEMPALRDRRSDIPQLARHFLERHGRKAGRRVVGFSAAAMACLSSHDWPGNVRELDNVVQRAIVLGSTPEILADDFPDDLGQTRAASLPAEAGALDFHAAVVAMKKRVILEAFRRAGGSYVETARLLGVHPNYLHRLIRNLELKAQLEAGS